ncbi:MAG: nascent polypeptide-associated complex protein [Nanoarchaeota archaeon]
MFPGINPKEMQKAMKKLGIKQEEIDAKEVIIKTSDKEIVILNPQVTKVNMMGQDTFQIIGDIEVHDRELFSQEDINTIMDQTNCSEEEAKEALEKEGDIAGAILYLQKNN